MIYFHNLFISKRCNPKHFPNEMKSMGRENENTAPMYSRSTQTTKPSTFFPISIFYLQSQSESLILIFISISFLISEFNNAFSFLQTQIQISCFTYSGRRFSAQPEIPPPLHCCISQFCPICSSQTHHQ